MMDLIEQGMKKGIKDLREQIQDKRCSFRSNKGVLGLQVPVVSHKDFVSFKDKVMSMLANMESSVEALVTRMETLVTHMKTRDQEVRQKLVIYKTAMSTWVMATHEAPRVEIPKPRVFGGKKDPKERQSATLRPLHWPTKPLRCVPQPYTLPI